MSNTLQPTTVKCPQCEAIAPRVGELDFRFLLYPEKENAGVFECPKHGKFLALDNLPSKLPGIGSASEVDKNTFFKSCPGCGHDRASFCYACAVVAPRPFCAVVMQCPVCLAAFATGDAEHPVQ